MFSCSQCLFEIDESPFKIQNNVTFDRAIEYVEWLGKNIKTVTGHTQLISVSSSLNTIWSVFGADGSVSGNKLLYEKLLPSLPDQESGMKLMELIQTIAGSRPVDPQNNCILQAAKQGCVKAQMYCVEQFEGLISDKERTDYILAAVAKGLPRGKFLLGASLIVQKGLAPIIDGVYRDVFYENIKKTDRRVLTYASTKVSLVEEALQEGCSDADRLLGHYYLHEKPSIAFKHFVKALKTNPTLNEQMALGKMLLRGAAGVNQDTMRGVALLRQVQEITGQKQFDLEGSFQTI
jgi:hypothetical protein